MLGDLYRLVARAMVLIHDGIAPVLGEKSFASWALAIILLVMLVRLMLVPAFVKQIKSQRAMAAMQPKVKELREKYKHDRERLNREMMALQKEHGNPLLGCLPIFIQIPLFLSLFRVMSSMKPVFFDPAKVPSGAIGCKTEGLQQICFVGKQGLSAETVQSVAQAKLGGVSIAAAFTSPSTLISYLGANAGVVKVVCVLLIIVMSASTFITQKASMRRNGPIDPQQAQVQKILLYMAPLFLAVFGFQFPVGVLLYWLTTNLWTLGQQHLILNRMPPAPGSAVAERQTMPTGPPPKPGLAKQAKAIAEAAAAAAPLAEGGTVVEPAAKGAAAHRPAPRTKAKKKKGQRPGGRR